SRHGRRLVMTRIVFRAAAFCFLIAVGGGALVVLNGCSLGMCSCSGDKMWPIAHSGNAGKSRGRELEGWVATSNYWVGSHTMIVIHTKWVFGLIPVLKKNGPRSVSVRGMLVLMAFLLVAPTIGYADMPASGFGDLEEVAKKMAPCVQTLRHKNRG